MATTTTVITEALVKLNVVPLGGTATANQLAFGLPILNDLLRSWRRWGLPTWARRTGTFTLVANQSYYTMGTAGTGLTTRPTSILSAYVTGNGVDTPISPMSKDDWFGLSGKTDSGTPTQYWYDPALTLGMLYFWPVTASSGQTVTLDYTVPLTEMAAGDTLDIPDEWLEAVKFGLAWRFGPGTGRKVPEDIKELAKQSFNDAVSGPSGETGSFRFVPDFDG